MNKNHKINAIHVEPTKNLVVIVDNKVFQEHDTVAHIYRYKHANASNGDATTHDSDLEFHRTQMISTPYDLQNGGTLFFYSGDSDEHLFMVFCDGNALHAMAQKRCEYFLWKQDGVDDTTAFQSINDFQLIEGVSLDGYDRMPAPNNNRVLTANNVLGFQMDVSA